MNKTLEYLTTILTACAFFFFGNTGVNIQWIYVFLFLAVADILFGWINAQYDGTFTRRQLLHGLARKLGELFIISLAFQIDKIGLLKDAMNVQLTTTGFMIGYEGISVLNKLKIGGVPVPALISDAFTKIKGDTENGK